MNDKKYFIAMVLMVITVFTITIVAVENLIQMLQQTRIFAQTFPSNSSSSSLYITKVATNSYAISSGSSNIGTFDTLYTILGNGTSIKNESDLVVSTITKDYDSSPTIGYVKVAAENSAEGETSSSSQPSTLANPFAEKATINQKISTEVYKAIESSSKSNFTNVEIKCNFGLELSDWKCGTHGLLG
jgi:hypothetical protein